MPQFKDTLSKDFLEKYNGLELFKKYTPKVAKLPHILYKRHYNTPAGEVVKYCIKVGLSNEQEAAALEKAFNDLYGDM